MSINRQALFSSKRQNWKTPKSLYAELDQEFHFDCDPCCLELGGIHALDMLGSSWGKINFINPPYNESRRWIKKAFEENLKGKVCVLLLPARTDTIVFHEYIYLKHEIRFLKGRLKFDDSGLPAPFPSMVVVMR